MFLRAVDKKITSILEKRFVECMDIHGHYDGTLKCQNLRVEYDTALTNYFIKYGDLNATATAVDAYMKQKHRLIWQRRNPDKDNVGIHEIKPNKDFLHRYDRDADV